MASDDKTLTRIAALLRQAESTDNEHEAETFLGAAQRLATAAAIDLAVARAHSAGAERRTTPVIETVQIGAVRSRGLRTFAELFLVVGQANDITFDIAHNSSYVIAYGFASDIAAAKALYASVSVQMIAASTRYLATGEFRSELVWARVRHTTRSGATRMRWVERPVTSGSARITFQQAFARRVGERLAAAKAEAEQAAIAADRPAAGTAHSGEPETGTALVLREKERELAEFRSANSTARGTWGGRAAAAGMSDHAYRAGVRAGSRARLRGPGELPAAPGRLTGR